jgi:hypothetical protein
MKYRDPLKQILSLTREHWDRDETCPAVRWAFGRAMQCRTPVLGAEVYASEHEERIFNHTCKSRPCASCGHRGSLQWRRERRSALPNVPYKGITFTMPDVLWPIFRDNPALAKALPDLAAKVIQTRICLKHALRVGVIAILHTFNGKLEFNSHVHAMVTAGGLKANEWVPRVYYDIDQLRESWRKAVVRLLRAALLAGQLRTRMDANGTEKLLALQENRWWSVDIKSFSSQQHFLEYAGRYVRRPPIAQRRIVYIGKRTVTFWYNDKLLHRRVYVECSLEEFTDRWAQHIPDRYQHSVRSFGLFGPRSVAQTAAFIFAFLGQKRELKPKPYRWAAMLMYCFKRDPLLDRFGERMKWARRIGPNLTA